MANTETKENKPTPKRGRPPKNSDTPEQSRDEKGQRAPRVPMGSGGNLTVSPAIMEEIKAKGCVPRFCLDNDKGQMAQYLAAYWEPYEDANGNQVTRPSGSGRQYVLMMLDEKLYEEDKALNRKRNSGILNDKAKLQRGDGYEEYIPDDREYVISPDL